MRNLILLCALLAGTARAEGPATLDDIEVSEDQVVFVLDHAVQEDIQMLAQPHRLNIDLPGTLSVLVEGNIAGKGRLLSRVRAAASETGASPARTVLELTAPVSYRAKWDGGRLTVTLMGDGPAAAPETEVAPVPAQAPQPAPVPVPAAKKPSPPKVKIAAAPAKPAAAPAAPAVKGFFVQAGSFGKRKMAEDFQEELAPAVSGWAISEVTVNNAVFYRLRAGPFATRAEAQDAVGKLAAMNEKAIIVSAP